MTCQWQNDETFSQDIFFLLFVELVGLDLILTSISAVREVSEAALGSVRVMASAVIATEQVHPREASASIKASLDPAHRATEEEEEEDLTEAEDACSEEVPEEDQWEDLQEM